MIRAHMATIVASMLIALPVNAATLLTDNQLSLVVAGTGNGNGNGNIGTNNGNGNTGNNNGNGNVGNNNGNGNTNNNNGNGNLGDNSGNGSTTNFNGAVSPLTSAAVTLSVVAPAIPTVDTPALLAAVSVQPSLAGTPVVASPVATTSALINVNQLGVLGGVGYAGAALGVAH